VFTDDGTKAIDEVMSRKCVHAAADTMNYIFGADYKALVRPASKNALAWADAFIRGSVVSREACRTGRYLLGHEGHGCPAGAPTEQTLARQQTLGRSEEPSWRPGMVLPARSTDRLSTLSDCCPSQVPIRQCRTPKSVMARRSSENQEQCTGSPRCKQQHKARCCQSLIS